MILYSRRSSLYICVIIVIVIYTYNIIEVVLRPGIRDYNIIFTREKNEKLYR